MRVVKYLSGLLVNTQGAMNRKGLGFAVLVVGMVLTGLWVMSGWSAQIGAELSDMVAPLR